MSGITRSIYLGSKDPTDSPRPIPSALSAVPSPGGGAGPGISCQTNTSLRPRTPSTPKASPPSVVPPKHRIGYSIPRRQTPTNLPLPTRHFTRPFALVAAAGLGPFSLLLHSHLWMPFTHHSFPIDHHFTIQIYLPKHVRKQSSFLFVSCCNSF
jgi:hypothetical protein